MLVNVDAGTVVLSDEHGVLTTLPYQPLSDADMLVQARYHLFLRQNDYRRELVCRECREPMQADTQKNEDDDAWELMARCACRAIYGKIALSRLRSMLTTSPS